MNHLRRLLYRGILLSPLAGFLLYKVRFDIGGISLNVLDVLLLIAIVAAIVTARFSFFRSYIRRNQMFVAFVSLFVLSFAFPLFGDQIIPSIAGQWKSIILLPALYGMMLFYSVFSNVISPRSVAGAAFAGGLFVAVIALISLIFGGVTYDGRLAFPYQSPNQLAMVLSPIASALLVWVIATKRAHVWFWLAPVGLLAIPLFATQSLGAFSAVAVVLLSLLFMGFSLKPRLVAFSGLASAVVIVMTWLITSGWLQQALVTRTSLRARIEIWRSSFHLIVERWDQGIGLGAFQEQYLSLQPLFPFYQEWAVPHPHNVFLAALLGAGVFGLIAFLGLLVVALSSVEYRYIFSAVGTVALVVMLLHGLVDTTIFRNDLMLLFWASLVVMWADRSS